MEGAHKRKAELDVDAAEAVNEGSDEDEEARTRAVALPRPDPPSCQEAVPAEAPAQATKRRTLLTETDVGDGLKGTRSFRSCFHN